MLQIVQGMYFRDVPLTHEVQRAVCYTNLRAFRAQDLAFVFGRLLPSTTFKGPRTITIEAIERLETVDRNGGREVLAATSGDQLVDEIAAVVSFALNVTCVRDGDTARRLIATREDVGSNRSGAASLLRRTFDASVILKDEDVADLDGFLRKLVALERPSYEAAMRAIRRIVDATHIVEESPDLSYTLMVAALESLGQSASPTPATWSEYDGAKRKRIDLAVEGLDAEACDRVREAVLANEHRGLQRRFAAFVLDHVEPSFYRDEALDAIRPIAAAELPNALRIAYAIRSRSIHVLGELERELWMGADRSDTAVLDEGKALGLEGLARLSRHVIRRFVDRSPVGVDASFDYRTALPGIMNMRLAPQCWIHNAAGFDRKSAPSYFDGMLSFLIEAHAGRSEAGLVDMTQVLEKIDELALGLARREDRLAMVGIVTLWNAVAPVDIRRNLTTKQAKRFAADLAEPSMVGFALKVLLGERVEWATETLRTLAAERSAERLSRNAAPLPSRIDAALLLHVVGRLLDADVADALGHLSQAVETVPGVPDMIRFETAIRRGERPRFDMTRFIHGEAEFVTWPDDDGDAQEQVGNH
jgi:hypothetical protein